MPHGYHIIMTINEIGIEYEADCKYDALRIDEMRDPGTALLGRCQIHKFLFCESI